MTTRDSFTHTIRAKAQPIWDRELKHPFVRGLGDGTLPIDRFRFYLAQDYVFLIEYCRSSDSAQPKRATSRRLEYLRASSTRRSILKCNCIATTASALELRNPTSRRLRQRQ